MLLSAKVWRQVRVRRAASDRRHARPPAASARDRNV